MTYETAFAKAKKLTEDGIPSIPILVKRGTDQYWVRPTPFSCAWPRGEASRLRGAAQRNRLPATSVKLDEDKVREIRATYKRGVTTQQSLADRYGVSLVQINTVLHRRQWADVA
jgi:hypothetical protein